MKKQWVGFLLFFLLPVLVVLWLVGAFAGAKVEYGVRGPYHYAYIDYTGDYSKILDTQDEVYQALKAQGIEAGAPVALILDDPRVTAAKELRAQAGYLVAQNAPVKPPLKTADIPERRVLIAQVKAHPMLAPSKAYSALLSYLKAQNMTLHLPTFEIYQHRTLTVEMNL